MNISKSTKIALAMTGLTRAEVRESMGVSKYVLNKIVRENKCSSDRLEGLATAFNMSVAEFISLGE